VSDLIYIEQMSRIEAQACLLAIRGNLESAKEKTLDFDRRLGWKAMDYPTLAACFEAELGISFQHGYRLLAAAEVEQNVRALSPIGESPVIRERWVRETGIARLEPAQQAEAYQIAAQIVDAEAAKRMTTAHIKQAVAQVQARQQVFRTTYFPVSQLFATGKLALDEAKRFVEALDRITPRKRGYILQLTAKFEFRNPDLVEAIASLFDRPEGQESLVLPEVLNGFLGGVVLTKATMSDWKRANQEASKQHIAVAVEEQNQLTGVAERVVTIALGDWERTKKRLVDELGAAGFTWLHQMMLSE
jgi:hypothetical protein